MSSVKFLSLKEKPELSLQELRGSFMDRVIERLNNAHQEAVQKHEQEVRKSRKL